MINQDFSQLADTSLRKMQVLFSDEKVAKLAFGFAMLILLCALYSIIAFGLNFNSWQLPDPESYHSQTPSRETNNIVKIENKHLFGKITKPGATLANAIKSTLPLLLKGVMNESDPKLGAAIIAGPDNVEKNYHVGDKLPIHNATVILEYIFKDKVYIKNDDTIEYLLYPKLEFKNQPRDKGSNGSSNQFLPKPIDGGGDMNVEPMENFQDKQPDDNQEKMERMPQAAPADKISDNRNDFKYSKFNRLNKKHKRNYN